MYLCILLYLARRKSATLAEARRRQSVREHQRDVQVAAAVAAEHMMATLHTDYASI